MANQVNERAARIDGLLTQMGATGSTLREKAASLSGILSSQTISDIQQLDYLRENALQGGGLSDVEMERFNRLSESALSGLNSSGGSNDISYQAATPAAPTSPAAPLPPAANATWDTPMRPMTGGIPEKLKFITIPLLILLVMQILGILFLPFLGPFLNAMFSSMASDPSSGVTANDLGVLKIFTGGMLWVSFLFGALWAAFIYFTWRAMQQGKNWARIAAIVLGVLSLLNFPIGTILGVLMLMGALDKDVQNYASR